MYVNDFFKVLIRKFKLCNAERLFNHDSQINDMCHLSVLIRIICEYNNCNTP